MSKNLKYLIFTQPLKREGSRSALSFTSIFSQYSYCKKVIYSLKLRGLLPLSSGEGWGEAIFWEEFVPV